MQQRAIRVLPDLRYHKLDPVSRLNFGAIMTVQHNLKVKSYGMVDQASGQDVISQFASVWNSQ